jgi:RNA polymerase sigma factor (sigma-70 family)
VPSDQLNVETLRESDEKALEEIARHVLPEVELMLVRLDPAMADSPEDMLDIMQDVLVDVLRNRERLSEFETSDQVFAYCLRLARNAVIHKRSREYREVTESKRIKHELQRLRNSATDSATEIHDIDVLIRTQLEEAISQLSDDERKLVMAFYFEGQTLTEIAEAQGVSYGIVRARLNRILKRLRRQLLLTGYEHEGEEQ